ncbi:MAG: hypothetical protein J6Y08_02230 [Clostridiales bacterium]|nr:hypothetical protein [Clostridiales bacterium]
MNYNFDWDIVSEGAPYVTISSLGLAFNMASVKKLDTPEYVMLGFDCNQMVIGVKPVTGVDETEKNVYQFKGRVKNNWVRIGCKDFVKYLEKLSGEDYTKSKRYMADFDSDNDLLIVKVSEEGDDDMTEENI